MLTRTEEALEGSDTCFEIFRGHIRKQSRAQFLYDRGNSDEQFGAPISEMKRPGALIIRISPASYQIAAFKLIDEPYNSRPLDVQTLSQITLTYATSLADAHECGSQGS
jgi:hypothetical protein